MQLIKLATMVVCVTSYACLVIFVIVPKISHRDSTYTGQESFPSQAAYEDFKSDFDDAVSHGGADIISYKTFISESQIEVDYYVGVPYNYDFPYGVSTTHALDWLAILLSSLVTGVAIVFLPALDIFYLKWGYKAYPMPKKKVELE
ncbi:MAG: hypothetical protein JSW16_03240 [Dehalococcoidales bacterium]|nr:MAG: hypothetical protein JSW16_03240 [Dehalococcoidales bacterium]